MLRVTCSSGSVLIRHSNQIPCNTKVSINVIIRAIKRYFFHFIQNQLLSVVAVRLVGNPRFQLLWPSYPRKSSFSSGFSLKRRKEEIGIGREESERRKRHRPLYLFSVSFFETISLYFAVSLYLFSTSTSFSPLLAFLSVSLSPLVSHSQFLSMSLRV